MWNPVVICSLCRFRHTCRRHVSEPCSLAIVCHGCETSLTVEITPGELTIQQCANAQQPDVPFYLVGVPVPHQSRLAQEL